MLCYNTDSKLNQKLSITSIMKIFIMLNCSFSPLTNNITIYVVWWSWFCLSSRQNAFYRRPSNQSKVQQAALHLEKTVAPFQKISLAPQIFSAC